MDNNIIEENIRQDKISRAKKSFTEVNIKSSYILKCQYEGVDENRYNTIVLSCDNIKFSTKIKVNKNTQEFKNNEVFVLILLIELIDMEYMISVKVDTNKNDILEYNKFLNNKFKILFGNNKSLKYKIIKNTNTMGRESETVLESDRSILLSYSEEEINDIAIDKIKNEINNTKDIENNTIENKEIKYKSVIVDVELDNDVLILSYNNQFKWVFKKDEYGLFCKNARRILENREGSEYAITIKNDGDESSNLKSENNKWWIKEDSIM